MIGKMAWAMPTPRSGSSPILSKHAFVPPASGSSPILSKHALGSLLFVFVSACTTTFSGWSDCPTAEIHPEAPAELLATWTATVDRAARAWWDAVGCERPFVLGSGSLAHPVELIPLESWTAGDLINGQSTDPWVHVRADVAGDGTILHELGHALGLPHDDAGEPSVMTSVAPRGGRPWILYPRDVVAARAALCP